MCWSTRERASWREPAGAGAGQVDHVAGDVVGEVGQQRAERRAADRPAVDEQHVGPASDPPVGDLAWRRRRGTGRGHAGTGRRPRSVVESWSSSSPGLCSDHCETIDRSDHYNQARGSQAHQGGDPRRGAGDGVRRRAQPAHASDGSPSGCGISDRIVVYYFPTKDELVSEVLLALGAQLQRDSGARRHRPAADHLALVRAAWPVLARPDADPVFALFFEANGLAATGRAPYERVVPQLVEAWIAWAADLLEGDTGTRRAEAEAAIALIDGLLLLRQLGGPAAADRAAHRLGVTT